MQSVSYRGRVPLLIEERVYAPVAAAALRGAGWARRLQSGRLGVYALYLTGLLLALLALRAARVWSDERRRMPIAGVVQVLRPGPARAAAIPGLTQWVKARLQGRRGASPLQPYRELARLWRKSVVDPEGTGPDLPLRAGDRRGSRSPSPACSCRSPATRPTGQSDTTRSSCSVSSHSGDSRWRRPRGTPGTGSRCRARAATSPSASPWRPRSYSPSPAPRSAGFDDRPARDGSRRPRARHVWSNPAQALALVAFLLVVVAETGRQPVDNPDTHLELTMIHEGPLLEYAGRDLALLAVGHGSTPLARARARGGDLPAASARVRAQVSRCFPSIVVALAIGLGVLETLVAKLRILLVPRLLGAGAGVALLAVITRLVEARR